MKARLEQDLMFHQSALNARAYRQQLLASNIANADTPNFQARDIDFSRALQGALGGRIGPLALATSSPRHLLASTGNPLDSFSQFRAPTQASADGNTVDMDVERSAFSENAVHYEASITFINGLLNTMQRAIAG